MMQQYLDLKIENQNLRTQIGELSELLAKCAIENDVQKRVLQKMCRMISPLISGVLLTGIKPEELRKHLEEIMSEKD